MAREVSVIGIDAGGTMTDALLVDREGRFVVGKAQSNPADEAAAILSSIGNGVRYWGGAVRETLPSVESFVYSGTAVLNRLLERRGLRLGAIVSAGHEDYFRLERGKQTYVGYSFDDQLHAVSHAHNVPLIPRDCMCGVRERINFVGEVEIPLYEAEVEAALRHLLLGAAPVEGIVVSLLYAYKSDAHERRVAEIARRFMQEHGIAVPLYLSSELYPLRGDLMRLNTLTIDAYCAAPAREVLRRVNARVREHGYRRDIRVMTSYGGAGSVDSPMMAHTVMSGPIGGVVGSRFLARHYGTDNLVCSDIGGTSFDVAIVTRGNVEMSTENAIARSLVNIPMIGIESIGAGTGSFVSIDPTFKRPVVSERSAGYRIGLCWPEGGVEQPTINDCNVILGRLNPDYFLGGDLDLDVRAAVRGIEEQLMKPLGMHDPYATAAGVLDLIEMRMKDHLRSVVMAKGYTPDLYTCVCYGGGGPTHVASYTAGLGFKDVLVPTWAAAFSAFGCACTQPSLRRDITLDELVPPLDRIDGATRSRIATLVNETFARLEAANRRELLADGWRDEDITFTRKIAIHYRGQLKPLEITCPVARLERPEDLDRIVQRFEDHYARVYSLAARFPQAGYVIASVALVAEMPAVSPTIPVLALAGPTPPAAAHKGRRRVYWSGPGWVEADIFEMDRLEPGNEIPGPAVIESQTTTFVVPGTHVARLDAHLVFHLAQRAS